MNTVSFIQMCDGSSEDYALLARHEAKFCAALPERILNHLATLKNSLNGYKVDRLEHSLQTATRAKRDGADTDWIVSALLHDLGDDLAPHNHDSLAAAILKPYVREECSWVVHHHGIFQYAYYGDKVGLDPEARQKYREHPYYDSAVIFCERWDQTSFDPAYDTLPLSYFTPLITTVFSRPAWQDSYIRPGEKHPMVSINT